MRTWIGAFLLVCLPLLGTACATNRGARGGWQPGESIICPHCGTAFSVPEKLGR